MGLNRGGPHRSSHVACPEVLGSRVYIFYNIMVREDLIRPEGDKRTTTDTYFRLVSEQKGQFPNSGLGLS